MKLMKYLTKVFRALVVLDFLLAVSKAEATAVEHVGISISENGASHRWPVTPFRFEGEINGILLNTSGTIQEIYAQAAKHPMFAEEHKIEEGKPELAEREKNPFEVRPLCSALASYAQEIATTCRKMHQQRRGWVIGGQAFGNEGFNVIIHDDKC
ncbi:uncharacterized protein RAG0_09195 [Rhynchosporium agropyri]|uniref:Uncharacterized protein n=1 Tax=Rhynchosporium agropyri TaxID=914238 RepID=A0A1E1KU48_9HELO|nr:uncharacterized protein RAG0_09195 [Rhynchosporium agropyri]